MQDSNGQYYLRSIGRALDVLDCFDGKTAMTLKDVAAKIVLPDATLFRVLLTLEKHGYLQQAVDGAYQLAPKLRHGWLVQQGDVLREKARPFIEQLSQRFNETVSVACLYEDRIHVVDAIESYHEIRVSNRIGRVLPPHCSAMGKAITAYQERPLAERILEIYGMGRRTGKTIVDRHTLFAEFASIRKTGISYDRQESIEGGLCIAAAIRREGHAVTAAISVSTPLVRMSAEREAEITEAVLDSSNQMAKSF